MKTNPEISIVIPMFNCESFIAECLESIFQQTFEDFEIIIVNDRSTDRSAEISRSYRDPRIMFLENSKNLGANLTRNVGIDHSRGKYVYFMDHDDAILPQTLEIFYQAAEESGAEVVHMNSCFVSDSIEHAELHRILKPQPRFFDECLPIRLQEEFIDYGCEIVPWIKIQRRDFLIEHDLKFPATTREGDTLFHLAQLCLAKKIQVIDAFGYVHRLHSENLMRSSAENQLRHAIQSLPIATKYMEDLFARQDLISPLPAVNRILTEAHMIRHLFGIFILPSYLGELNPARIDDILCELVEDSEKRLLLHTLAAYLIQLDIQRKKANQNLESKS